MWETITLVGIGGVFGLALAAPPGPMNAIIAEESVHRGMLAGVKAGLGAMSADLCFFALAVLGVGTFILDRPTLQAVMVGIGGVLMLVFGVRALRNAFQTAAWSPDETAATRGFWKTFVLGITNPYQLAFWLTVGIALVRPDRIDLGTYLPGVTEFVVQTGQVALFVGLFGGILGWIVVFPASLQFLGRRIDRFAPLIAFLSAVVLVGFGAWFLLDAGTSLAAA